MCVSHISRIILHQVKVKRLESQIILKSLGAVKPKALHRIATSHDFDYFGGFAIMELNTTRILLVLTICIYLMLAFLSVSKAEMYFQTMDIYCI